MLNSKGFSLIELIFVVAILSILVGVAVPVYNNVINKAEHTELIANAKIYRNAAQSAISSLGTPDENVVWGDSEVEEGEWVETTWLKEEIENGIIVTISESGDVAISFQEESANYQRYVKLIEKFGELT